MAVAAAVELVALVAALVGGDDAIAAVADAGRNGRVEAAQSELIVARGNVTLCLEDDDFVHASARDGHVDGRGRLALDGELRGKPVIAQRDAAGRLLVDAAEVDREVTVDEHPDV